MAAWPAISEIQFLQKQRHKGQNARNQKANALPSSAASMLSVATQNLINILAVSAVSGTVLLRLLAAKHF
jgi:hypothetical protein